MIQEEGSFMCTLEISSHHIVHYAHMLHVGMKTDG